MPTPPGPTSSTPAPSRPTAPACASTRPRGDPIQWKTSRNGAPRSPCVSAAGVAHREPRLAALAVVALEQPAFGRRRRRARRAHDRSRRSARATVVGKLGYRCTGRRFVPHVDGEDRLRPRLGDGVVFERGREVFDERVAGEPDAHRISRDPPDRVVAPDRGDGSRERCARVIEGGVELGNGDVDDGRRRVRRHCAVAAILRPRRPRAPGPAG